MLTMRLTAPAPPVFWAKTTPDNKPGISVLQHCLNVGCVAQALIEALPQSVRALLPAGSATLAAAHDIGKITIGFQAKCPAWLRQPGLPDMPPGQIALAVSDHALVSQLHLQQTLPPPARLWAVAAGAHHGRVKGRSAKIPSDSVEPHADWAQTQRDNTLAELRQIFGELPAEPPQPDFAPHHTDLWLLAGLITVADWIGSNEAWFPPDRGLPLEQARQQARAALAQIGWPGASLRRTDFPTAFRSGQSAGFQPNPVQQAVAQAASQPGLVIVEGPMGCGKTEAALFAAQQLIASRASHGIYFALPTQVTSNRIHLRVASFLGNTLAEDAPLRLAHGNAWLEDDFDLRLRPALDAARDNAAAELLESAREARSWFASPKQALLATYGVGTVDQVLQGVVAVKHFFVRRFALAGKVVILDEVHSYDIYTGTLITALVRELLRLGCSVIILSATLTAARRKELLAAAGITENDTPEAYPLVTSASQGRCQHAAPEWRRRMEVALKANPFSEDDIRAELIRRAKAGQHVLWIRNTVIEAQQTFRALSAALREGTLRAGLLHGRFPFQRRAELEAEWLELLGKNRPETGPGTILIATQVVEQSVDIDLDFIVSDLAPADMLLQRIGRLWRHERPRRAAARPEFWVRLPDLPAAADTAALKKSLGRSARVYDPYVLLRSMAVWQGRDTLELPAGIRPLLEATYSEPDASEPAAWRELREELEKQKAALALNAESATRVLGNPALADKDELLTRRKGPPSTPVIFLRSVAAGLNGLTELTAPDGARIAISDREWRRAHARFLHQWLARVPRWMVPQSPPRPRWLDLHAPPGAVVAVVRDDGRCVFGGLISEMTYDPRLGIFADRPAASAQPSLQPPDDDDEFDC